MLLRIHKLSPIVANQIAAGEVIERPASVLKELIENSLDAGATEINIDLEQGGMAQIEVRDNGSGIHREDLRLAIEQHATSKIKTTSDLEGIVSFGFRGEALASIASVAKVSLKTRLPTEKMGWQLRVEGGIAQEPTPIAMLPGTIVEVRNLFFNTPARRKFLRSDKTELFHTDVWLKRLAMSAFRTAFWLKHQGKVLRDFKSGPEERRVTQIYGQTFMQQALRVSVEATGLTLWGWIGAPQFVCNQALLQNLYVNGRWVRDKLILHAVKQVYQDQGFNTPSPAYLLYLEVDAPSVDVNVHPTKYEVRFRESRLIYDFIHHGLSNALTQSERLFAIPEPSHSEILPDNFTALKTPSLPKEQAVGIIGKRFLIATDTQLLQIFDVSTFYRNKIFSTLHAQIKTGVIKTHPFCIPFRVSITDKTLMPFFVLLKQLGFQGICINENSLIIQHAPTCLRGQNAHIFLQKLLHAWLEEKIQPESETLLLQLWQYFDYVIEDTQNLQTLLENLKKDPLFEENPALTEKKIDLVEWFHAISARPNL